MFERVLVANRGEVAVRIIRALHELGVEAVAVFVEGRFELRPSAVLVAAFVEAVGFVHEFGGAPADQEGRFSHGP